ncbi:MAG: hypothetical protein E6Q97_00520 [Desulfurellales bacterium]|nr:MAG: hypothetical protein E6Q97_00520 [Desulfurellales bacterium]
MKIYVTLYNGLLNMGLLSRLFHKLGITRSEPIVVESPQNTLSTWVAQLDSLALSGQPSVLLKRVQNTTEFMDTLQGLILERARAEVNDASIRAAVSAYPLLPHIRYSPRLYHDGLEWVCVWGGGTESSVVGRGESPRKALEQFDSKWNGTIE